MENDHETRGLPASDGPLQGFFGGARRCAERATNLYAGQDGGSPSGELGRLTGVIARLETKSASFEGMWRRVLEFAKKSEAKATRQDRRVEFILTRALQRMLESDKLKRDHEDRGKELSANRREIGALQTGLSPIKKRLAAELNASNRRAVALQAQLASITTGQAGQVDLTASDAQGTAAYRDRAQLIARITLLETEAMMAREDADLDRAKNPLTIYTEDQQI